jgi:GNAT superfamily N-acetyltransferase
MPCDRSLPSRRSRECAACGGRTPGDAGLVFDLDGRLHAHLASSPTLLPHGEPEDVGWWTARLSDPRVAIWIAETSRGTVGYLIQGLATDDACDLIVDPGTSSITGAYVLPEARRGGTATALLARAVKWAREQGYTRLSVDFETANVEGARFWLRHFRPVVVSFARTVRASQDSL